MSTGVSKSRNRNRPDDNIIGFGDYIDLQLAKVRTYVRLSDLAVAVTTGVTLVALLVFLAILIDHWIVDLGRFGRFSVLASAIGILTFVFFARVLPLLAKRLNPAYVAKVIENSEPSLKNSLLNFVLFRSQTKPVRKVVLDAVERQAAADLAHVDIDATIDHTPIIRIGAALGALMFAFALYAFFSPKDPIQSIARILVPWNERARPSRVEILNVEPGTTTVYSGRQLDIAATVNRLRNDEHVAILFSTADGQAVDSRVELQLAEPSSSGGHSERDGRWKTTLPESGDGLHQDITYKIVAGDATAGPYRVKVLPSPSIVVEEIKYDYPQYMNREPLVISDAGEINSVEGTRVTVRASANQQIESAYIEFDADQTNKNATRKTVPMQHEGREAVASFTLKMKSDRKTPWHTNYQVRFRNLEQASNERPVQYGIQVTPDIAPVVEILTPGKRNLNLPVNSSQTIEIRALDPDYGLEQISLNATVRGDKRSLDKVLLRHDTADEAILGQRVVKFRFSPSKLRLRPGDIVDYQGIAKDNRIDPSTGSPTPNVSKTEPYRFEITAPDANANDPNQGDPNQENQDGEDSQNQNGEPGENAPQENGDNPNNSANENGNNNQQQGENPQGGGQQQQNGQGDGEQNDQQNGGQQQGGSDDSQGQSNNPNGQNQDGQNQNGGNNQNRQPNSDGNPANQQDAPNGQSDREQRGGQNGTDQNGTGQHGTGQHGENETGTESTSDENPTGESNDGRRSEQADQDSDREIADGQSQDGDRTQNGDRTEGLQEGSDEERTDGNNPNGEPQNGESENGSTDDQEPLPSDGSRDGDAMERILEKIREKTGKEPKDNREEPPESQNAADGDGEKGENPDNPSSRNQNDETGENKSDERGENRRGENSQDGPEEGNPSDESADNQNGKTKDGENETRGENEGDGESQASDGNQLDENGQPSDRDPNGQEDSPSAKNNPSQRGTPNQSSDDPSNQTSPKNENPNRPEPSGSPDGDQGASPTDDDAGKQSQDSEGSNSDGGEGQIGDDGSRDGNSIGNDGEQTDIEPEEANLDYAREATDLVLDYLKNQRNRRDPELLDELGWTPDQLAEFTRRWNQLKQDARRNDPVGVSARGELDEVLRSLGLAPSSDRKRRASTNRDNLQSGNSGRRSKPPAIYRQRYERFLKSARGSR